jgi:hypothetical protein
VQTDQAAALKARRRREEERLQVVAAGLSFFDAEAEESARAYEAAGEELLAKLASFRAAGQRKDEAWRRSKDAAGSSAAISRRPSVFRDLEHLGAEIKDALRSGWPANSERSWREFLAREQAPPGARLGNREAAAQFEVLG